MPQGELVKRHPPTRRPGRSARVLPTGHAPTPDSSRARPATREPLDGAQPSAANNNPHSTAPAVPATSMAGTSISGPAALRLEDPSSTLDRSVRASGRARTATNRPQRARPLRLARAATRRAAPAPTRACRRAAITTAHRASAAQDGRGQHRRLAEPSSAALGQAAASPPRAYARPPRPRGSYDREARSRPSQAQRAVVTESGRRRGGRSTGQPGISAWSHGGRGNRGAHVPPPPPPDLSRSPAPRRARQEAAGTPPRGATASVTTRDAGYQHFASCG